jgi:predicted enzyme related to lactoylglutathione lyase
MKLTRAALAAMALCLVPGMVSRAVPQEDPLASIRPYLVSLTVPDARKAAQWYERKLGFAEEGAATDPNGTRMIVLVRNRFAIELLQVGGSFSITAYKPHYRTKSLQLQGISKFGFAVNDLEAAWKQLTLRHVRIVLPVTDLKQFSVRFFEIEDNNGNVIQVFQASPGGK